MSEQNGSESDVPAPLHPDRLARFHRFQIGALECVALSDGSISNPMPPAPGAAPGPPVIRFVPLACLLVRMPGTGKLVLLDSGFGFDPARVGQMLRSDGRLVESLALAGFAPGDIDAVLISHLDPDHVGGLYDIAEAKTFTHADYYAPAEAIAFWSAEDLELSSSPCPPPVKLERTNVSSRILRIGQGTLKTFEAGSEVLPGITAMALPGHAPGQVGFLLKSEGETLFYSADAIANQVISIQTPEVHNIMDLDPVVGSRTREKLLQTMIDSDWHTFSPHFSWPNIGKLGQEDGKRVWKPHA